MTVTPTVWLEGAGNSKISISQAGLRALFGQIEAELHRSETYHRTVAGLQQGMGEAAEDLQKLVKAVGREAIRLALRQLVRQYRTKTGTVTHISQGVSAAKAPAIVRSVSAHRTATLTSVDSQQDSDATSAVNALAFHHDGLQPSEIHPTNSQLSDASDLHDWTVDSHSERSPATPISLAVPPPPPPPITPAGHLTFAEAREAALSQIGYELRQARMARSLSLDYLHSKTRIPLHQLKALEAGEAEHLPEDIYICGFIRRAGDALGLDGAQLAASLPTLDPAKTVIPSWHRSVEPISGNQSAPAYVGYAALMAGAIAGVAWLSYQPVPQAAAPEKDTFPDAAFQSPQTVEQRMRSGLRAGEAGSMSTPNIAPPETMPF